MDHDPEISSWLHDLWGNIGELSGQESPEPLAQFFQQIDLRPSVATETSGDPMVLELDERRALKPDWEEMLHFLRETKKEVERGSMTKRELRASLGGVLRKFATALGA